MSQSALSVAALLALTSCFIAGPSGLAYAELDQCNDVLKGDLQNKLNVSSQQAQSTLQFATATFFSETELQAFSDYQNEARKIDFSKTGGDDQGHVDAHYGLIGGAADFAHSYNHELSADEFHVEWSKHQLEYKQSTGQIDQSGNSSASSLVSSYASTVRDPVTIEAWKECMIKRSPQAGITALGFRDESGEPFINIFWVPGELVGVATSVHVKFPQNDEFDILGADEGFELAKGSGQNFPVRLKDTHDPRANHVGFSVLVNGEVKINNVTIRSFASAAAIPRNFALDPPPPVVPPDACRPVPSSRGLALGPRLNKKYVARLGPPLDALQANFILNEAVQCDVVPEVPDFSCFRGTADVPTRDNGNATGFFQLELRAPNEVFGAASAPAPHHGEHRFRGTCDNRGLIVGKWRYFKNVTHDAQGHVLIEDEEAPFEIRQSGSN